MTLEETQKLIKEYLEWFNNEKNTVNELPKMVDLMRFTEAMAFVFHLINVNYQNVITDEIPVYQIYWDIYQDKRKLLQDYIDYVDPFHCEWETQKNITQFLKQQPKYQIYDTKNSY